MGTVASIVPPARSAAAAAVAHLEPHRFGQFGARARRSWPADATAELLAVHRARFTCETQRCAGVAELASAAELGPAVLRLDERWA